MRTICKVLVAGLLATGCLSNPARKVASNGQPLKLEIMSGTGTRYVEEEAGRSVTTHADGAQSETVNYQTVAQRFKWKTWRFYQGHDQLDEQDWFALRDPSASARIAEARKSAERAQLIGLPMAIVGYLGVAAMQYGYDWRADGPKGYVAYIGSSLLATVGTLLYVKGVRTMRNKTLLPLSRGFEAADQVTHCKDEDCRLLKSAPPPVSLRMR